MKVVKNDNTTWVNLLEGFPRLKVDVDVVKFIGILQKIRLAKLKKKNYCVLEEGGVYILLTIRSCLLTVIFVYFSSINLAELSGSLKASSRVDYVKRDCLCTRIIKPPALHLFCRVSESCIKNRSRVISF